MSFNNNISKSYILWIDDDAKTYKKKFVMLVQKNQVVIIIIEINCDRMHLTL